MRHRALPAQHTIEGFYSGDGIVSVFLPQLPTFMFVAG
jgi:hypothetical protein